MNDKNQGISKLQVAVFSDIHGNRWALEAVLKDIKRRGIREIVNPGSVGLPAYTDDLPFPHAMETCTPHARYSIVYRKKSGWWVENIAVPYDWESAAAVAAKNGRPDWAKWLRTGYCSLSHTLFIFS